MSIHMIFFDLGDTLVKFRPEISADSAQQISSVSERIVRVEDFRQAVKDEWAFRNGENIGWVTSEANEHLYWYIFYHDVLQRLRVKTPPESLLDLLSKRAADPHSFECFKEVKKVLAALSRKDVGIGLISNAFPSARRILEHFDLTHWFDPLVLSYEYPSIKPKPARDIYEYALDCAHLLPKQTLFVDDRSKFVEGAIKVGMEVKLLDRESQGGPEKISDLRELLEIV